jgi:carbamoyl-phosphate synthase large subunit
VSRPAAARAWGERPRRVVVLGSGALQIGQAGEFDYSGSQALKALREEGIYTVVINPNIATVQTAAGLADAVYFLPVTAEFVAPILARERADAILLGFGGQSALNCGLELADSGALERLGVRVLGTSIAAIRACEDRQLFADSLQVLGLALARGRTARTVAEAQAAAASIGFPLVLRAGFALGGRGSAVVRSADELAAAAARALHGAPQVLLEESLLGWKELEYELLRDPAGNAVAVCTMENVDPMGVHTGESIVVAPAQTLSDSDHQMLRDAGLQAIAHLGIVGECNIQFALDPRGSQFRVIEVNPRLSRSSALASKATGYSLAYVAAKLALGYTLPELRNAITGTTSACFEPALDYLVCKVPRWDLEKFDGADLRIGTEMKSVGEVMAIGLGFGEALQKALRMIEVGADGFDPEHLQLADLAAARSALAEPTTYRVFALARALALGMTVAEAHALTAIDPFFLRQMQALITQRQRLAESGGLAALELTELRAAKAAGFSDAALGRLLGSSEAAVRRRRRELDLWPQLRQIDTLAGEYPTQTNYLYLSYPGDAAACLAPEGQPADARPHLLILGSGCYRIGSSVEFDASCVAAVQAARELGHPVTLLNCNPETVSTDYDQCDRLIFDEVSLEVVLDLWERPPGFLGVLGAMGGQTPNRLAVPLAEAGVRLLGTAAAAIDRAEDRAQFSALCDALAIDQPRWTEAVAGSGPGALEAAVAALGGFPVLVRPSYVLSGAAMRVASCAPELQRILARAARLSPAHPVVISKFERHARELELDGVAAQGEIILWAISEHVEDAGVHSGDATLVLPPLGIAPATLQAVRRIAAQLARALEVSGPFNLQLLARGEEVKVIECNLRASRSFPLVSKVLGCDFVRAATRVMLGAPPALPEAASRDPLALPYFAVKAPMFSFRRLTGADPLLGVEMASTGEVGCFGRTFEEALAKALLSTGFRFPRRGVLLSLGPPTQKARFIAEARSLHELGLRLYATAGTAAELQGAGLPCVAVDKGEAGGDSAALSLLRSGEVDLVLHLPRAYDEQGRPDGFALRRAAIDCEIPLLTSLELGRAVVRVLRRYPLPTATDLAQQLELWPWHEYLKL